MAHSSVTALTHSGAMATHFGPHAPVHATGFPATIHIKILAPGCSARVAEPSVMNVAAPKPIRASVKPAAIAGRIAGQRVRRQLNLLLVRS
jgi:hypothetical protein